MTPLILTLLLAVIVVFSALVGFVRGFSKTVVRLITLALAIVATFFVSIEITNTAAELALIEGQTLGQYVLGLISGDATVTRLLASAPLLEEAILTAPSFVIGFVVFPVAFLLLSFVSWILFLILSKPLRRLFFKEKGKVKVHIGKRFAGFLMGAVTGVLIFAMLMAPIYGLLSVLPEKSALEKVVDTLEDQGMIDANTAGIIKGELVLFESPIYTVPTMLGVTPVGEKYLATVSKIERDGEVTYLTDEFGTLFAVVETAIEGELLEALTKSAEDQNALYAVLADEAFMNELIGDMFNSKLLRSAIPEVTAIAIESAARMLGVPESKEEVYDNMMTDIAELVKNSDVNFEGIAAYEEANNITYADVMFADEQVNIMTEEEYNDEIKKLNTLEKNISKIVNKNVAGGTQSIADGIAKGFVKTVKEQVKTEGADSLKEFNPEKAQQKMAEIAPEDIAVEGESGSAVADMLNKMKSADTFETKISTVADITNNIRDSVKNAVKDDSKSAETSGTLASVVSNFAGAVSSATDENGNFDPMKLDFEKVGDAVGALQGSTLDGVGSAVLDLVVSGDLGKNEMLGATISGIKDAYDAGTPIADTVKTTGDLLDVLDSMNNGGENLAESFENLVKNLKQSTLDLLSNVITDETLISFGIPEEQTKPAFKVIEKLLGELLKLQGAEDYDNEVNAILALYEFATGDLSNVGEDDIPELVDYAIKSDAIYNTLVSISEEEENPFGIEFTNEDDLNYIAEKLDENYEKDIADSANDKERVNGVYKAIATFFGVNDRVNFGK